MDRGMTQDPFMSRQVRAWLHETADELPVDPALFAGIKAGLGAPRPRPWAGLFRSGLFRSGMGRAVAVSLLAAMAIVAVGVAFREPGSDTRLPAVGAAPSPSSMLLPEGRVPPGRHSFARDVAPLMDRYDVSLDVPAGWTNENGGWVLTKGSGDGPSGATVEVDVIDRIAVDPCHPQDGWVSVPVDSTPEGFAAILTSWGSDGGIRPPTAPSTTEPVFGTFDGRPGVEVTVQTRGDIDEAVCTGQHYTLWGDERGGERYIQGPGESFRIRAIQVGSELLFLAAGSFPGTPAEVLAEQQAMLDSVRIVERPVPSSAPASEAPATSLKTLQSVSSDEAPGRYRIDPTWLALGDGYEVSLELAAGWDISNGMITSDVPGTTRVAEAELDLFVIDKVFNDPCTHVGMVDGRPWYDLRWFAASLTTEWSDESASTNPITTVPEYAVFDGYTGFQVTASIPTSLDTMDCAGRQYQLWRYADGSSPRMAVPGEELLIRVIAVDPVPPDGPIHDPYRSGYLSIVAASRPGAPASARQELLAMVDSIRITPVASASLAP
jgi:hypothetical protein